MGGYFFGCVTFTHGRAGAVSRLGRARIVRGQRRRGRGARTRREGAHLEPSSPPTDRPLTHSTGGGCRSGSETNSAPATPSTHSLNLSLSEPDSQVGAQRTRLRRHATSGEYRLPHTFIAHGWEKAQIKFFFDKKKRVLSPKIVTQVYMIYVFDQLAVNLWKKD